MSTPNTQSYQFSTFDDIASVIKQILHDFSRLKNGEATLQELMINAVEHGNLEINFEEKQALLRTDTLSDEIEKRLTDKKFKNRKAVVTINEFDSKTVIEVCDDGNGFAWQKYLAPSTELARGLHGRGILLSKKFCTNLKYNKIGNKVVAVIDRHKP